MAGPSADLFGLPNCSLFAAAGASGTFHEIRLQTTLGTVVRTGAGTITFGHNAPGRFTSLILDGGTTAFSGVSAKAESLTIGGSQSASMSMSNGGQFSRIGSKPSTVTIGLNAGVSGTLNISDAGSNFHDFALMVVGAAGAGTVNISSGGLLSCDVATSLILAQQAGSTGTINVNTGGVMQIGSGLPDIATGAGTAAFNLAGGTLQIFDRGAGSFSTALPMTLSGDSIIRTDGTTTLSGALSGSGSLTKTGPRTLTVQRLQAYTGNTTVNEGTLALSGATSQLTATSALLVGDAGSGSVQLSDGAKITTPSAAFGIQTGVTGSGSMTGANTSLSVNTTLSIGQSGTGTLSVGSGASITAGSIALGTNATGSGTLTIDTGGTLNVGGVNGIAKGVGAAAFNLAGGTLKVTNADLTSSVPISLTHLSTIDTSGVTATLSGTLSGSGGILKTGAGTLHLTSGNSYTGGTGIVAGTISVPSGTALGSGNISVLNGSLQSTGSFSRDFETTVDGASSSLSAAGFIEIGVGGTGSLAITNGSTVSTPFSLGLGVLPGGTLGTVNVTGAGSTLNVGTAFIIGVGANSSGLASVGAGGTINAGSMVLGAGGYGTFNLNPGGQLNVGGVDGIATLGPATFHLAGGVLQVAGSSLTSSLPMTLSNLSLIDTNGLNATLSGVLSDTGGLAKAGAGTLTLSGQNTYTGSTIVYAGALALGVAGALPDASPVVLDGGTLDANGFSDTAGTLALHTSSTIDLDLGVSSLAFAKSSALPWTGTLTITGFTIGSDTLRFGTDTSGLTAAQLAMFRFADYGNATAVINSQGFVTVPEPGSAGLGLAAGLVFLLRRRR